MQGLPVVSYLGQHSFMQNIIPDRIRTFLKDFPPFSLLTPDFLQELAEKTVVRYCPSGEIIFREGDQEEACLFVVREGAVDLLHEQEGEALVVDVCDEGDLFGLRALVTHEAYSLTAKAREESLIYRIPIRGLETIFLQDPQVAAFLLQMLSSQMVRRQAPHAKEELDQVEFRNPDAGVSAFQPVQPGNPLVHCTPETTIHESAMLMRQHNAGSVLVLDGAGRPLGIVTDRDLRNKALANRLSPDEPVSVIMSTPVITASPGLAAADAQLLMLRHRIRHLCLTEDGTSGSKAVGMISQSDLLVLLGNSPAALARAAEKASSGEDLRQAATHMHQWMRKSLEEGIGVTYLARVAQELYDILTIRAIELSLQELEKEGGPVSSSRFCWLALGSAGRGEQLLPTDQDNALVFEAADPEDTEAARAFFLRLAQNVNDLLESCGFAYCPAGMMAGNPANCLALQEWKERFSGWIAQPAPEALMHCTIFFDFRPVYGDKGLASRLSNHISESVRGQDVFFGLLAKNALSNPAPLTFFRQFVVEHSGEHKDAFDLKSRAMMPVIDAARLLALHQDIKGNPNTFQRLERLAEKDLANKALYVMAAQALEVFLHFRARQGIRHGDSGRFIQPEELTKMDRLALRNGFVPIKELHLLIRLRFRTDYFGG